MSRDRHVLFSLLATAVTWAIHSQAQSNSAPTLTQVAPAEVVGRWALVAVIRNGKDVTQSGVTQSGVVSIYHFKADGTFSIARGESVTETGVWAANAMATPKTFDHTPNVDGKPGPFVPGIYESGRGVLKICILPPSASRARPTRCEAKPENGSRIYILSRETQ